MDTVVLIRSQRVPVSGPDYGLDIEENAARYLAADESQKVVIVWRYRQQHPPLVKDSVQNWRTGRLEFVLDGDFEVNS